MTAESAGAGLFVGPGSDPDRYQLGSVAGAGAEGVLYRGSLTTDSGVVLDVAIKMLHPRFAHRIDAFGRRWREQVELFRSLQVAGMVKVRDGFIGPLPHPAGQVDATSPYGLYLVMNWVDGEALETWAARHPGARAADRLKVLLPIAAALDLAHSGMATGGVPVVHCDIKPANILVTSPTDAVLVDIGLTRVLPGGTRATAVTGTPGYLSPEVLADGEYSPASDRYALGVVAWSLLTGREPPTTHEPDIFKQALEDSYPDRPELVAHVLAMLDARPEKRPALLANWCAQLRNSSLQPGDGTEPLAPAAPPYQPPPPKHTARAARRKAAIAVGLAVLLAAAVITAANRPTGARVVHLSAGRTSTSTTASTSSGMAAVGTTGSATTSTAPPSTTAAAVAPPPLATCTNPELGYTVTLPAGWQTHAATTEFSTCQLFSAKPINPAKVDANPLEAPIEFGSLAQTPTDLSASTTSQPHLMVAGYHVFLLTSTPDPKTGEQPYTYLIDRGRTTLVADLLTPPGATAAQRHASQRALDAMIGSLKLQKPTCLDSRDGRCGDFYWRLDPASNQAITATIDVNPKQPQAGQPVTITVTVSDPDDPMLSEINVCYGDAPSCGGAGLATTGSTFRDMIHVSMQGPVHGPWTPPRVQPGSATFTFTHIYQTVDRFHFQIEVRSSNPNAPQGHDPYQNDQLFDTFIVTT